MASFFLRDRHQARETETRRNHRKDKDQELTMTVSIGVAETFAEMTTFDQELKSARRSLYRIPGQNIRQMR
jgi:PleD family two-component response regulator